MDSSEGRVEAVEVGQNHAIEWYDRLLSHITGGSGRTWIIGARSGFSPNELFTRYSNHVSACPTSLRGRWTPSLESLSFQTQEEDYDG